MKIVKSKINKKIYCRGGGGREGERERSSDLNNKHTSPCVHTCPPTRPCVPSNPNQPDTNIYDKTVPL